jgi:putative Holliday junction resolvase
VNEGERILAVDFGDRRTGLAATDHFGKIAFPLPALIGLSDQDCAQEIANLAKERDSQVIVVGMPLDREGRPGQRARRTMGFVQVLEKVSPCPVATTDEAMTTDEAHRRLKEFGLKAARRKKLADSVAAMIILERYRGG